MYATKRRREEEWKHILKAQDTTQETARNDEYIEQHTANSRQQT
jgi:hypothetical protein